MTSMIEGQPPQKKALSNQNKGHLGSRYTICVSLPILCDPFGMVKRPFQRLSHLQLGDKKVTLNHLVCILYQVTTQNASP